jgi:hypothetical protein
MDKTDHLAPEDLYFRKTVDYYVTHNLPLASKKGTTHRI